MSSDINLNTFSDNLRLTLLVSWNEAEWFPLMWGQVLDYGPGRNNSSNAHSNMSQETTKGRFVGICDKVNNIADVKDDKLLES